MLGISKTKPRRGLRPIGEAAPLGREARRELGEAATLAAHPREYQWQRKINMLPASASNCCLRREHSDKVAGSRLLAAGGGRYRAVRHRSANNSMDRRSPRDMVKANLVRHREQTDIQPG